jgi:hypothetical protein
VVHRLRVSENRVLRRIFGPKSYDVIRGWRKLHNEELPDLYSSSSIIRMAKKRNMRWTVYVARLNRKGKHIGYWGESRRKETTMKTKK